MVATAATFIPMSYNVLLSFNLAVTIKVVVIDIHKIGPVGPIFTTRCWKNNTVGKLTCCNNNSVV